MNNKLIIVDNFIDEQDALMLIKEQNMPSEINPYPEYYKTRYGGTSLPYNKIVMDILSKYGKLANEVHIKNNPEIKDLYVYKAFGSHWTAGSSGGLHIDANDNAEGWIEWSTVVYLNDDFEGGEIYFPKIDFSYKPKKYSAVFFPGNDITYLHGISEITSGHRYTALYMHTTDASHADPDFSE